MRILKFGGTSLATAERMKALYQIAKSDNRQIIVLSAVSGTTNALVEISSAFQQDKKEVADSIIKELRSKYDAFIQELFTTKEGLENGKELIDYHFKLINSFSGQQSTHIEEKVILAQGELLSTTLFYFYLTEIGVKSRLLPALDFMKIDEDNEPDIDFIRENLQELLDKDEECQLFITQGFICRNSFGEIDNLRRGGSDYTASLIGAAIQADEVQIWTDIDGMHNNDPRVVNGTKPIEHISFNEAAELAYFGAKILHPQSVFPAQRYNVPVKILDTLDPSAPGTTISAEGTIKGGVRAIAAKDGITAINIHSSRMLLAYGFLRRVFEIFERYKTPIDMITTSEVAISLTIDETKHLEDIKKELEDFGEVELDYDQTIICVVGDFSSSTHGYTSRVLDAVKHLPVRMISYGGSEYNISLLVNTADKVEALKSLHNRLF
ncbi:aspartate kinase [Albibacterium sp.]|uniref:aspartate kinase n=1 Tax=Albibacterium sp. TaxID=2952885 RepID=UPI002CB2610E|nr:aspartate kinase [Albibacterium sp.]HUH18805.1 aspartate kinase [Albibacterium sp.]